MSAQRVMLAGILTVALLAPSLTLAQPVAPPISVAVSAYSRSMLIVENAGQWPEAARFQVRNSPLGAGTTWLAEDAIWLVVSRQVDKDQVDKEGRSHCDDPLVSLPTCLPVYPSVALKLSFPGSNPTVHIEPFEPLTTTVSYFIGEDPAQWRPDVPAWGGVRYEDLYPGIDLVLGGRAGGWRLDAAPGAAVEQVRVQVEGVAVVALDGSTLHLDGVKAPLFVTLPSAPFAYQAAGRSRQGAPLALAVRPDRRSSQAAGSVDNPSDLLYGTFLGGGGEDSGSAIAVDAAGSAYVAGHTHSAIFPATPGAFDPSYNGYEDAFVAKLNPAGSGLVYATFLGGTSIDHASAIAVDDAASAYVTGDTGSTDFPTTPGAFDTSCNGDWCGDAFVVKLNPAGNGLAYATFLGGREHDIGDAIAVDEPGSAYVTGFTRSADFPSTWGAFAPSFNGGYADVFVAKLNPTGSALAYATFLGGSGGDSGDGIAVDGAGSAFVTGGTNSSTFPTTPAAFDPSYNGGGDAFVLKLNPAGSGLIYATFLGGSSGDGGRAIALDETGSAYVTGQTWSIDFPTTPGALDPSFNGGDEDDAFVAKLNSTGSALVYSTFLGGSSREFGSGIAVDGTGNAYVTGPTTSVHFPTTQYAFDSSYNGTGDAFLAKLNPTGSRLAYATFFGGSNGDGGEAIALDGMGGAYLTGSTVSTDFPTTPYAFDPYCDDVDAFVVNLDTRSDWWLPLIMANP